MALSSSLLVLLLGVTVLMIENTIQLAEAQHVSYMRLKKILDTSYDKRRPPLPALDSDGRQARTLTISLSVHIHEILLEESKQSMLFHADIVQRWTDDRLSPVTQNAADLILSHHDVTGLVWTPELYIHNARQTASQPDARRTLIIASNGHLSYKQRLLPEVSCVNLTRHFKPLICGIEFQIYGSAADDVVLEWDSITTEPNLSVQRYSVIALDRRDCDHTSTVVPNACKYLSIVIRQEISLFVTEVYGSTFLLVLLSWIGFWIDGRWTLVRLALGLIIVTVLVIYGVGFRILNHKIGASGIIEVWLSFCLLFVLSTLVEFVFVHVLIRVAPSSSCGSAVVALEQGSEEQQQPVQDTRNTFRRAAKLIDTTCGLIFPILFILFNSVYWSMVYF